MTWTATASVLIELANAIAWRAGRSSREIGTITIGRGGDLLLVRDPVERERLVHVAVVVVDPGRRSIRSGTSTITSHEPWKKLLLPTTSATTAVVSAPSPLIARPARQPGSRRRHQRTSMPACDRVKAMNTPSV